MGLVMSNDVYKRSGVDIDAGAEAISRIKKHVRSTFSNNVIKDLGGFGGCFQFPKDKYKDPILVSVVIFPEVSDWLSPSNLMKGSSVSS